MTKLAFSLAFTSLCVALFSACGRSTLDSYPIEVNDAATDARVPVSTCTPSSCPRGCCDSTGNCRAGTARDACGTFGEACDDCPREGFPLCDLGARTCGRQVDTCDGSTCADGCCAVVNGSPVCLRGNQNAACGNGGQACQDCNDAGLSCDGSIGACTGQPCNGDTCPQGCCLGNQCLNGLSATTCGGGGAECENCEATARSCAANPEGVGGACTGTPSCSAASCSGCCDGDFCLPGGDVTACGGAAAVCAQCADNEQCVTGACVPLGTTCAETCAGCCLGEQCLGGSELNACGSAGAECSNCATTGQQCANRACAAVACNADNCADGCCAGDVCRRGEDAACGSLGGACENCAASELVCASGVCIEPCTPDTCAGCCNGNACEAGFLNGSCGSNGSACNDCSNANATCDVDALPRACVDTTDCPAAYGACPAAVTTPVPQPRDACTVQLLANAAAACSQGPNTTGCKNFFTQLANNAGNAACGECLAPFRFTFNSQRGVVNCLSPFVGAACNHATGCAFDCEDQSCQACAPSTAAACRQNVRQDQCGGYFEGSACLLPAIVGAGSFCSPIRYNNAYGEWLRGVGAHFCDANP